LLKNQLARALESFGDNASTSASTDAKKGGGGAKKKATRAKKNNKHALDVRRMSKQAVRERQRKMRRAGAVEREAPSEAAREAARKRNSMYFAAELAAEAERNEHAAKLLGTEATNGVDGGGGGESDDDDGMLW